jgi:SAM-dependent methyltransferase
VTTYDVIGRGYRAHRRADPRIAAAVAAGLGHARRVLNVGAGTGSYEPADRDVIALEPSRVMIAQRAVNAAPVAQGVAEHLPFRDDEFDAVLAILTMHHWSDRNVGLRECRRVARRIVILTWDPSVDDFWLVREYFPSMLEIDRPRFTPIPEIQRVLGGARAQPVLIPADCADGFLGAYWRRPGEYLDRDQIDLGYRLLVAE